MSKQLTTEAIRYANGMMKRAAAGIELIDIDTHRNATVTALVDADGERVNLTINGLRFDELDKLTEYTDRAAVALMIARDAMHALILSSVIGMLDKDHAARIQNLFQSFATVNFCMNDY